MLGFDGKRPNFSKGGWKEWHKANWKRLGKATG